MLGDKLKKLRIENEISQEQLIELTGVSRKTLYSWETNRTQPPYETICKLAEFYGVTTDYLLGIDYDEVERLRIALKEAGIEDIDQAMKIVEALKEKKDTDK